MFSGKSEELIRRIKRAIIARQRVQVFKPAVDTRYSSTEVVSHGDLRLEATCVPSSAELAKRVSARTEVVGIDEAQFFDDDLASVCDALANRGVRVILAGLDMDYRGKPFTMMPRMLAIAEIVTKIQAVCMVCGAPASFSQRLSRDQKVVAIGSSETYEARCRRHFEPEEEQQIALTRRRAEVLKVPPQEADAAK
tara:strand:- start:409 stop:993 length:585 start_codon:yes stop_codon:yes gene_type:complete